MVPKWSFWSFWVNKWSFWSFLGFFGGGSRKTPRDHTRLDTACRATLPCPVYLPIYYPALPCPVHTTPVHHSSSCMYGVRDGGVHLPGGPRCRSGPLPALSPGLPGRLIYLAQREARARREAPRGGFKRNPGPGGSGKPGSLGISSQVHSPPYRTLNSSDPRERPGPGGQPER